MWGWVDTANLIPQAVYSEKNLVVSTVPNENVTSKYFKLRTKWDPISEMLCLVSVIRRSRRRTITKPGRI